MLLKNHLEAFRKRYAYHLRNWHIESKGIRSHQRNIQDKQSTPLRLVLQPAGMADKVGREETQTLCILSMYIVCVQGNMFAFITFLLHFPPSLLLGKRGINQYKTELKLCLVNTAFWVFLAYVLLNMIIKYIRRVLSGKKKQKNFHRAYTRQGEIFYKFD